MKHCILRFYCYILIPEQKTHSESFETVQQIALRNLNVETSLFQTKNMRGSTQMSPRVIRNVNINRADFILKQMLWVTRGLRRALRNPTETSCAMSNSEISHFAATCTPPPPPPPPPLQKNKIHGVKAVKALHATSPHKKKKQRGQAHKHKPTLRCCAAELPASQLSLVHFGIVSENVYF